jgi:hypothetical protein
MASKKNQSRSTKEMRSMRTQQVIFLAISIIIILAMVLSATMKF